MSELDFLGRKKREKDFNGVSLARQPFFQVGTSGPTGTVRWATAELACAIHLVVGPVQWGIRRNGRGEVHADLQTHAVTNEAGACSLARLLANC